MNVAKQKNARPFAILSLNMVLVGVFFFCMLNRAYPIIGHDYAYFLPHALDTYLHYHINGLSIQWYTPSFGGGLPAYANPQNLQFSPLQSLLFLFDPWISALVLLFIYILVGIACFYLFARYLLNLDWRASLLGALFFVVTGFYIGHMTSGQVGFMAFPLLSAIILILFWDGWPDRLAGIVIAVLLASLIYQAGFYTLIIFFLSCGITLPLLYLFKSDLFSFSSLTKRVLVAGAFALLISASKLYAIQTFMRYFPRDITYNNTSSLIASITSFVAQLMGTTAIAPWMAITGQNVNDLPLILYRFTSYPYSGLWETDNSISPVLIGIFIVAGVQHLRAGRQITPKNLSKDKWIALIILLFLTWFSLEYILAKGLLYGVASQLPLIKSLHFNARFISVFYYPFAICGTLILNHWFQGSDGRKSNLLFMFLNTATLLSLLSYFLYTDDVNLRILDVRTVVTTYQESKQGATFPVTYITDDSGRDWRVIPMGASTLNPYEPIFGYNLEDFAAQTHPGPIFETTNGYFNMTNPASLTFPKSNGGKVFSLFAASDQKRLEEFTHRLQPDWHIPMIQIAMDYVSAIAFLVAVIIIVGYALLLSILKKG